jgi:hypothetical protein
MSNIDIPLRGRPRIITPRLIMPQFLRKINNALKPFKIQISVYERTLTPIALRYHLSEDCYFIIFFTALRKFLNDQQDNYTSGRRVSTGVRYFSINPHLHTTTIRITRLALQEVVFNAGLTNIF